MSTSASEELLQRLEAYETLPDALLAAPRERSFITVYQPAGDRRYEECSFGQFLDRAGEFAALFHGHSLSQGDPLVLILPQSVDLMAAFGGAILIGAIPTILAYPNFKLDPEKYRHGLAGVTEKIQARLIVLDQEFPSELVRHISVSRPAGIVQLQEPLLSQRSERPGFARPGTDDAAFLQHSAGTTGLQKGVALPHRSVLNQLRNLVAALQIGPEDRIVSWLPLYHDMGLIACFILPLACHLPVVMQSPADWILHPASFLHLISRYRCTLCWQPNFAFQFLARRVPEAERAGLDLSCMRVMVSTSEPVRAHSIEEFYQAYQPYGLSQSSLQTSYGMAENTFAVTQSVIDGVSLPRTIWVERNQLWDAGKVQLLDPGKHRAVPLVSCGRCMNSNSIRVVGDDGVDLPEGRLGEILVRSDSLFDGYFNRPDLSARALQDGWYWTGDLGFLLEGEIYVIGRKDDAIIVGGKNLYPQDVEEIACRHPSIQDGRAVAFGVYNDELGTDDLVVVAEVSDCEKLQERTEIASEIRTEILAELGVTPRVVYIVPPRWVVKSTAGKPARSTNREKFLKEDNW